MNALCIDCPDASSVFPAIGMLMSFRVMAESKGVSVNKFIFLNDGVHQLMKEENIPVLNTLRKLASTLSVCADASRFFTEDTSVIYARIIGKKVKRDATNMRILYYLDNGVYGSFYNAHINEEPLNPQPIHVASQPSDAVYTTTLFGPTCDSIDTLGNDYMLPELMIGDWLKVEHRGYECCYDSPRFNGIEDPDYIIM